MLKAYFFRKTHCDERNRRGSSIPPLADVGARVVDTPLETPVGILVAAIGAPFFVDLARRIGRER